MAVIANANAFNQVPNDLNGQRAVPLDMRLDTIIPTDGLMHNCRMAKTAGFPILQEAGKIRIQPICIVGASPGLVDTLGELARRKAAGAHVMAIKGSHDYLVSKGITPDSAVAADPLPDRALVFKKRLPGVTYYMASQMDPDAWQYMRGYNVVIWHPFIDKMQTADPEWKGVKRVHGGNTTGLRAISLAWILGFRMVTLFGFESCVRDGGKLMRVTGEAPFEYDRPFPVNYAGVWFMTTASLAQQCVDFMPTLQMCPGIKVDAVGHGALPHILAVGKASGWPV